MSDADKEHENIRTRAYLLWEAKLHKDEAPDEYWFRAKEIIAAEHNAAMPPRQALHHMTP